MIIKATCVQKIRDKYKRIIAYVIKYECSGATQILKADELKSQIRSNRIHIANLRLTADNKLIDCEPSSISKISNIRLRKKLDPLTVLNNAKMIGANIHTIKDGFYVILHNNDAQTYVILNDLKDLSTGFFGQKWRIMSNARKIKVVGGKSISFMSSLFDGAVNAEEIDVSDLDTSGAVTFTGLFSGCVSVRSLDLTGFDTRNVKFMTDLFYNCVSLKHVDLSNFYTNNVSSMNKMFMDCKSLETLDLSSFVAPKLISMPHMFCGCSKLRELDISNLHVSSLYIKDSTDMFLGCDSLEDVVTSDKYILHELAGCGFKKKLL